jgi:DNA replication and repair protein RecF
MDSDRSVKRGELAKALPLQLFDPSTLEMLSGSSEPRRQLLDWGVFHVEHGFLKLWQQYRHALLQRNSLLKSAKISNIELAYWETSMATLAQPLTERRRAFFEEWKLYFDRALTRLLPDENISLHLSTGWDDESDLLDLLSLSRDKDRERGFTQIGPQRADVRVRVGTLPCEERLSRGQQKLTVCAMKLSVVELLINKYEVRPVLLLDDIASELDAMARKRVCDWIASLGVQVFATAIELNQLSNLWGDTPVHRFHVEHGDISHVAEAE